MDIDLLRPGTAPISPDTVLWFEFLLDPYLLAKHLEKANPDPTPTELIITFINSILESVKYDVRSEEEAREPNVENITDAKPRDTLKNLALKILCLKITAFYKWNLDIIESKIPVKFQVFLLQDLLYFTNEKRKVEIPNIPESDLLTVSDQYLFALILYHRWLIRMIIQRTLNTKIQKLNGDIPIGIIDDCFLPTPELVMTSVNFLTAILALNRTPKILTFDTFVNLNENTKDVEQDWEKTIEVSRHEFEAQIHYDLGCFYFHREDYDTAKQHFLKCSECYYSMNPEEQLVYSSFDINYLNGFLCACNEPVEGYVPSLLEQMNCSISNQYTGIISILQEDNRLREIPMMYRTVLELDIQGAISSGKFTVARDLQVQVQMLNIIRCVLDNDTPVTSDFLNKLKYGGSKATDILFWAVYSVLENCSEKDKQTIREFFIKLLMTEDIPELLNRITNDNILSELLNEDDYDSIAKAQLNNDNVYIPECLKSMEWMLPDTTTKRNPYLEAKIIEQKLMCSYCPADIKEYLIKFAASNPSKPAWRLNSKWELAIPLQSVVMTMPRGFIQDYTYILLAKSRELMNSKNYDCSIEVLNIIEAEAKNQSNINTNVLYKLGKLIGWEILIVEITQLLDEWPANQLNKQSIVSKCQACLTASEAGDTVIPRVEVIEHCASCLLNLGEWEFLCGFEKRWNYFEMATAVSYACQDLVKYKASKKISRDMWDIVLPIFCPPTGQIKRSASGNTSLVHRDSPNSSNRSTLMLFLSTIRDLTAISVVISMFARIYNVLRDEPSVELTVEYITLWPAVISNANSYSIKGVCETLIQLVQQSLKLYPYNLSWLKLTGDINYANAHYESALKHYLECLAIATDYFNQPLTKPTIDDYIFRRMIKCCTQLNCYTQAAVLCQFLDEIDYGLAFKCLNDNKSNNCYDAVDAYYNCIWDITILEYLVYLHHKRGENHRKQQAIKAIGMLELNMNNNEEIQREAMNVRKSRFLRAMTKQYLCNDLMNTFKTNCEGYIQ